MIERDDLDGLHTSWCALIGEPVPGDIPDCDCDPRDMLADQLVSDALDGAALRRLREAQPKRTYLELFWSDRGQATCEITPRNAPDPIASGDGATIAEAADKCREALTKT